MDIFYTLSVKAYWGTIVNRTFPSLHERSLKITNTVPVIKTSSVIKGWTCTRKERY